MKLFAGSASIKLASEVAKKLNLDLAKSEVVRFANSEVKVTIQDEVKDQDCIVIQSTENPTDTNLMELLFFCDALKRKEAKKIIAIIPYFGYARQNIQHREGECVSANVVINMLENIGFNEILVLDLHDEGTQGIFTIPFKNLTSFEILSTKINNYLVENNIPKSNIAIVSPDQGGVERARKFGEFLFSNQEFSLSVIEKKRDINKIHTSVALDLYGDVNNKTVILIDDILTSGGTLFNAANLCISKGAKEVIAAIVHHDFAQNASEKITESIIKKIYTTNTISLNENQKNPKLEEVSIASVIENEIKKYL